MRRYDYELMSSEDVDRVLRRGAVSIESALKVARPIIEAVRAGGDRALLAYARKYEGFTGSTTLVPSEELQAASARLAPALIKSLKLSAKRIQAYHKRQRLGAFEFKDSCGVFGQKVVPLERVGIYVPGGTAAYASSVLMAALPAKAAGVDEIAMCTPARNGRVNDLVLAAAAIAGVDEVYSVGGAQAIAALAYGTETIRPVLKIVGPGGSIVSAAKIIVRRDCEIDSVAGPSEVLIIADSSSSPELVAGEMAAQLEHDSAAVAVLVSSSRRVLDQAQKTLEGMIQQAPRKDVMERSSRQGAVFIKVKSISQALEFSNSYAPEHLVIDTNAPREALASVRNAGSVFLGSSSSVAFGDYCSGPNHVLPTMGSARSRAALSVYDFLKIVPYQHLSPKGAETLASATAMLAEAEGLPGHAAAARMRSRGGR